MTINHCPLEDLTPYAVEMVVKAMEERIAGQREFIARMIKKRQDGRPFFTKYEPVLSPLGPKYKEVGYFYLVWDFSMISPYEYIKDAELRIEELRTMQ